VIHNPNVKGLAFNYQSNYIIYAGGSTSLLGLPNIPDAFIGIPMRPCLPKPIANPPVSILTARTTVCEGECFDLSAVDAQGRTVVWHLSDGREIKNEQAPEVCFEQVGTHDVVLLAINEAGDTARSNVSLTVLPRLDLSMIPFSITTDTIGTVKIPIVLNGRISATFNATFSYDADLLEYTGAFDESGNRIDVGQQTSGEIGISKILNNDSVVGYLTFELYWESERCREVTLVSSSVSGTDVRCLSNSETSFQLCLNDYCGERTISGHLRDTSIAMRIGYDRLEDILTLTSSGDLEEARLMIVDVNGKIAMQLERNVIKESPVMLDVSALPEGVYFLSFSNVLTSLRKSFVIVR
jgi:PKD repeat protein